jgi:hypothetical protein
MANCALTKAWSGRPKTVFQAAGVGYDVGERFENYLYFRCHILAKGCFCLYLTFSRGCLAPPLTMGRYAAMIAKGN